MLLILGIANPLCCCSASLYSEEALGEDNALHSCCSKAGDSIPSSENSEDCSDCPHKSLQSYLSPEYRDASSASPAQAGEAMANLAGFQFYAPGRSDAVLMDCSFKAALGPPPQLFSQLYCIYRM